MTEILLVQHKGAALLLKLEKMINFFRIQNYYNAIGMTKRVLDEIMNYMDSLLKLSVEEYGIDIEQYCKQIESYLGELLNAQISSDYVLLADLYEIGIIPVIMELQSSLAAVNGVQKDIDKVLAIADKLEEKSDLRLGQYIRENAEKFESVCSEFNIEPAANGEYTAAFKNNEKRIYLHSNNKPSFEAYNFALSHDTGQKQYFVYGLGLGYIVREMLNLCSYSKITVYESRKEIVLAAALYGVLGDIIDNPRFSLVYDESFKEIQDAVRNGNLIVHGPSIYTISDKTIASQMEEYFVEYNSIRAQGRMLDGNFDININLYDAGADELEKYIKGKDVYLIAAGPSLDKNFSALKIIKQKEAGYEEDKKSVIICAGTVLKKLINAEIMPDFVIATDAKKNTYAQIAGIEDCNIPIIGLSTLYYEFFKNYSGRKYIVCQNGYEKAEKYAKAKNWKLFETGGSVMTTALDIAIRLKAKKIIFAGLDLAYTGGYNHAKDTNNYKKVDISRAVYVDGVLGEKVPSGKNLNIYRKWFEKRLSMPDVPLVINATEGGALIKGMENKALSSVIKENYIKMDSAKKYLLIKGQSQYDAMRIYIDEIAAAIRELGREAVVIDGLNKNFFNDFREQLDKNYFDAVITCNGILLDNDVMNMVNTTFCTLLYDQPVNHDYRISKADKNCMVIECDRNHAKYLERYYKNIGYVGFLPLSGSYIKDIKPFEERNINLLFTGSYLNYNSVYEDFKKLPKIYSAIANEVIDYIAENPKLSCEEGLKYILNRRKINLSDKEFNELMITYYEIEIYMRGYFREKVFKTILGAGVKIDVYGNGWNRLECKGKENLICHEGFAGDSLKALADTKVSLNIMPWFKAGFQERIASAMLCGAVSLTDESIYINENFTSGKELVTYNLEQIDKLPEIIEGLISEKGYDTPKIAEEGRKAALNGHTWKHRTKELLKMIDEFNESRL